MNGAFMPEPSLQLGSLVGFGAVFLALGWLVSALMCAAVLLNTRRLQELGPLVERRAAALALLLPPLLSLGATAILAASSWQNPQDHCAVHDHHLHLCLYHGGAWIHKSLTLAVVVVAALAVATRTAWLLLQVARAPRALARMLTVAEPSEQFAGIPVVLVPTRLAFCFTSGLLQPRIYISTAAWERLGPAERQAVLAHEVAHVQQRDLPIGLALAGLTGLGLPGLSHAVQQLWYRATERLCDLQAARTLGDPEPVATALLQMVAGQPAGEPALALHFGPNCAVTERVEAVLAADPDQIGKQHTLLVFAALALAALLLVTAQHWVDPLHHAIESLLGGH